VIELLEPLLGAPVALDVLKHKPGRRTTSRAVGARRSAIVKIYASQRAPVVAARLEALAAGPAEPVVPSVLLCDPDAHLVALSEVPGVPLRESLLRGELDTCARAGAAIGGWHRAWLGKSPEALVPHTVDRELEILEARIERSSPEVAGPMRAALPAVVPDDWGSSTVVHRDLYEEQVMVGERIGLIDLDDAALGPPELDVGNLLAHLDLLAIRAETDLAETTAALLDGYAQAGPPLDPALLARCHGLSLLRLACIHENLVLVEGTGAPLAAALTEGRLV
jgi:Ser/Thr protein kinase RdoA (MazF antagonist)